MAINNDKKNFKWQNRLLLLASLVFYGFWDCRFLSLLLFSTWVAYACGFEIGNTNDPKRKKYFLVLGITTKLCILGFFKYYNFFAENLQALFNVFGLHMSLVHLNIILPLGISFYTFQTMSYIFDVYRNEAEVTANFFDFALFGSFFPQLVAGPIERAKQLLPQVRARRTITRQHIQEGCYLILWGYFLKVFAADNLAHIVNPVFDAPAPYNGVQVLMAMYAFTFQIYCDFAGYSNIACGLARLMGFQLMDNFFLPFFVTNIREFWRRWHISLMSWLRDYLYIPMGGSRVSWGRRYINLLVVFFLSGLWHGARWNFIFFGVYHGTLMVAYLIYKKRFPGQPSKIMRPAVFWTKAIVMFHIVAVGMLLFRAQSAAQIGQMLEALAGNFHLAQSITLFSFLKLAVNLVWSIWLIVLLEYIQFKKNDLRAVLHLPWMAQGCIYFLLIFILLTFGVGGGQEFIYFQF